jgi:hypothetical protein
MVVIVAMVGLVVDGGYAWGKQRATQNGADSTAEAGAVVLMQKLAGVPKVDANVLAAVNAAASASDIDPPDAWYTNITGGMLTATGAVTTNKANAVKVGVGPIPPGASGVLAVGSQTFDTFLAKIIGFGQFTATAPATAVAGYQGSCDANAGCLLLPVTVPVTIVTCDGQNNPVPAPGNPAPTWDLTGQVSLMPLCKASPGNVGWLDWTPPAGGTSELIQAILTPSNPDVEWPGWYFVTSTGNVNSKGVEDALRTYDGKVVSFPQFDNTCDATPTGPGVNDCPAGHVGGHGQNQWYHIAAMGSVRFCSNTIAVCAAKGYSHGAYVNGSNKVPCDTGNGATACLIGVFTVISTQGKVTAAPGPVPQGASLTVQLIR